MDASFEIAEASAPVNVLVVDDRAENRTAVSAILSSPGYRIVEAGSSADALRRLLEEDFAVLLIDVVMPEMDGFELAAAIKERERTAGVPIVFMTAQAFDRELVDRGYRAGAADYLVKPLIPEMLRAKVAVFAELYRQRKRIEAQAARLIEAEQKEGEHRLLELRLAGERRYRALAEAMPHIIWTARADGRVDYFNQRWFEYTGITVEQAAGSWHAAVHPRDAEHAEAAWREALTTGAKLQVQCRLRRASDGAFHWHLCRAVPELGPVGQVLSWLGTFTDIEDQKRVESVLGEFKGTLDAVLDAVLIFEPESLRLLYVNQGASVMLGHSREDLLEKRPVDFMAEHDEPAFRELLASLRDGSKSIVTIDTKFRRTDGRLLPVEVSLQLIPIDGGRVVSIARDITDRKRAQLERELLYQQAVDAIRARDEFLSVASHELRTPLSSLQLQIEMLLRPSRRDPEATFSPVQTREKLEKAARQIERLSRLISELMDVSRITAGRLRLELEETDLSCLARDTASRLSEDARRARCEVSVVDPGPVTGKWDRMRLEQVVTNLLTNAFKFGAGKPIDVVVEQAGPLARLVVRDRGIGIAPEDAERIFHRYEQAISSRVYGGLGLGLYIVRQIVEAHGGTIRVESQPGSGTAFTVELPREAAVKEAPSEGAGKQTTEATHVEAHHGG